MDICGHQSVRERLGRIAALSVAPQSFLFAGPQRLGKFLVALEFAEKLSGTTFSDDAHHPDLLVIGRSTRADADEVMDRSALSVEVVREAEEFLSRFPTTGKYRIVIIDEADRLTPSAENALLKILEEPNSTSVIILVTHRPGQLLATVRSRLFAISFIPVPSAEVRAFFSTTELPDFFFSLGLPGLVAEAARDALGFGENKEFLRSLFRLSQLSWAERIGLAEKLSNNAEQLPDLLEVWISGLARQRGEQAIQSMPFATFLETALETLDRITKKEGNPRLLLEKLFTVA